MAVVIDISIKLKCNGCKGPRVSHAAPVLTLAAPVRIRPRRVDFFSWRTHGMNLGLPNLIETDLIVSLKQHPICLEWSLGY